MMSELRIIGVDPGFASTGLVVLGQRPGEAPRVLHAELLRTEKTPKKKGLIPLRASVDDSRRVQEQVVVFNRLIHDHTPHAVCMEAWAPFSGRGGGNAWKTAITYGVAQAVAMTHQLPVYAFIPADLRRSFGLPKTASKTDIADALVAKVPTLGPVLAAICKTQREHVSDGAGHAYQGFVHIAALKKATGLA